MLQRKKKGHYSNHYDKEEAMNMSKHERGKFTVTE